MCQRLTQGDTTINDQRHRHHIIRYGQLSRTVSLNDNNETGAEFKVTIQQRIIILQLLQVQHINVTENKHLTYVI